MSKGGTRKHDRSRVKCKRYATEHREEANKTIKWIRELKIDIQRITPEEAQELKQYHLKGFTLFSRTLAGKGSYALVRALRTNNLNQALINSVQNDEWKKVAILVPPTALKPSYKRVKPLSTVELFFAEIQKRTFTK